jgi:hypothetical protein
VTRDWTVPDEPWENDHAHQALNQWIYMFRQSHPSADLPNVAFTAHIGREAVALADGMGRIELLRLFAGAGTDGECVCGMAWTARPLPLVPVPETVES